MKARRVELGEDGQAMVEFALTFPLILTMVTLIMQFALAFNGAALVRYAAYNAARSASVWLPLEGGNGNDADVVRRGKIAVAISMAPACPKGFGGLLGGLPGLGSIPDLDLIERLGYAYGVMLAGPDTLTFRTKGGNPTGWDVRDTIIARVNFYFALMIPPANHLLWEVGGGESDPIALTIYGLTGRQVKPLRLEGKAAFIYTGLDRPS